MLKEWIETGQVLSKTNVRGVEDVGPLRVAGVRRTCSLREIGPAMETALCQTVQGLSNQNLPTDGTPISVYHKFDLKEQIFDFTTGVVIPAGEQPLPTGLDSWSLPACRALAIEHIGRYDHVGNAWSAAYQVARYKKLKQSKLGSFEMYRNDPETTAPADLRTEIYLPLR